VREDIERVREGGLLRDLAETKGSS
jgi:hypothetical protein